MMRFMLMLLAGATAFDAVTIPGSAGDVAHATDLLGQHSQAIGWVTCLDSYDRIERNYAARQLPVDEKLFPKLARARARVSAKLTDPVLKEEIGDLATVVAHGAAIRLVAARLAPYPLTQLEQTMAFPDRPAAKWTPTMLGVYRACAKWDGKPKPS